MKARAVIVTVVAVVSIILVALGILLVYILAAPIDYSSDRGYFTPKGFSWIWAIPGFALICIGLSASLWLWISKRSERTRRARRFLAISAPILIAVALVVLVIGYTQPTSRIRVEVYNAWHTGASVTLYIDNITDGKVYDVPPRTLVVFGVWSVHAGTHDVTIVSDDFLDMVFSSRELTRTVHVLPYEIKTAAWGLALI